MRLAVALRPGHRLGRFAPADTDARVSRSCCLSRTIRFSRNSIARVFMAPTADGTSAWALMRITGSRFPSRIYRSKSSIPNCPRHAIVARREMQPTCIPQESSWTNETFNARADVKAHRHTRSLATSHFRRLKPHESGERCCKGTLTHKHAGGYRNHAGNLRNQNVQAAQYARHHEERNRYIEGGDGVP